MINVYLVDTVKHVRPVKDKWQKTIDEETKDVKARKIYKMRRIITAAGEEAQSEMTLMMKDMDVKLSDLWEVDGQRWATMSLRRPRDFSWAFLEVLLGRGTRI